jgi:urease accessory protein
VGRVFREADVPDAATVVIQSVSGTVNAGDRLAQEFLVGDGARARIRSQGAVAVHRANDGVGSHEGTRLVVASGGVIENLTEPRLLFPGADYSQQAVLDVAGGGVAIHVEAFIDSGNRYGAGRYSAPRSREAGSYASQTRILRDGVLLAQEVSRATLPLPGEHPAHALVILAAADVDVAALDAAWSEWHDRMGTPRLYGAASALPFDAGISVRIAAADGRLLREAVASCVAVLRTVIR